jgi:hypothetical protein
MTTLTHAKSERLPNRTSVSQLHLYNKHKYHASGYEIVSDYHRSGKGLTYWKLVKLLSKQPLRSKHLSLQIVNNDSTQRENN